MPYLVALLLFFNVLSVQAAETSPMPIEQEKTSNSITAESVTEQTEPTAEIPEVYHVFTPQFMNALSQCKPAQETNRFNADNSEVQIIAFEGEKCHLRYADFDLYVPLSVLANIHGFDDLQILLHNPEIAHYNFQPQYTYNGLLHALNSCFQETDYFGFEKKEIQNDKQIKQGIEAEFVNDVCTVYLVSEMEVKGVRQDYTVTCRIDKNTVTNLMNFYREILEKYGEKRFVAQGKVRVRSAIENKQTRQADDELMYFLQQKGYCQ